MLNDVRAAGLADRRKVEAMLAHFAVCQRQEAWLITQRDGQALVELLEIKGDLLRALQAVAADSRADNGAQELIVTSLHSAAIRQSENLHALQEVVLEARAEINEANAACQRVRRIRRSGLSAAAEDQSPKFWA